MIYIFLAFLVGEAAPPDYMIFLVESLDEERGCVYIEDYIPIRFLRLAPVSQGWIQGILETLSYIPLFNFSFRA